MFYSFKIMVFKNSEKYIWTFGPALIYWDNFKQINLFHKL